MSAPTAIEIVRNHLAGVLPPGVPPNYQTILKARFVGTGRSRIAVADLVMIDGLKATCVVFGWMRGMEGHRWSGWEGGDLYFEDGAWRRAALTGAKP